MIETLMLLELPIGETGHAYRGSDGAVCCARCDYECEWETCYAGCEDGYFDGYEEDPLWYDQGDLVPCSECGGHGGSYWCDNRDCATGEIWKISEPTPKSTPNNPHVGKT